MKFRDRKEKIKEAKMTQNSQMYIYATEMVGVYYSILRIKNKTVLSVCGSGDQIINAYFYGAKRVLAFDINKFSEYIFRLKEAAIKKLTYKEFLEFFGENETNVGFEHTLYNKLSASLNKRIKKFFDGLYKKFNFEGNKLASSNYFRYRNDFGQRKIKKINSYLKDERSYNKLKKILAMKNIDFIQVDLQKLHNNKKILNKKFDLINLSNVPNYLSKKLADKGIKDTVLYFYKNIFLKLKKRLNKSGKIMYVSYSESIYPNRIAKRVPLLSREESLKRMRKMGDFDIKRIPHEGLTGSRKDYIFILTKKIK